MTSIIVTRTEVQRHRMGLVRAAHAVLALLAACALPCVGTSQTLNQKLVAPDAEQGDRFGSQCVLLPGWIFVSAPQDDDVQSQSGAVYVFERTPLGSIFRQKLKTPTVQFGNVLGTALAATSDWLVATAPNDIVGGVYGKGSAHVFRREGGTWVHFQKLIPSDWASPATDSFGLSAAIDGDVIVIGEEDNSWFQNLCGSAYVFELQGGSWVETAALVAGDPAIGDSFGTSVDVDGDVVVVGAHSDEIGPPPTDENLGAVYVFERQGTTWVQRQKLRASDPTPYSYFGFELDLEGSDLVIAAGGHEHNPGEKGAAYTFVKRGSQWEQSGELLLPDPEHSPGFGMSISIDAGIAVIGAITDADNGFDSCGSAYMYGKVGSDWQLMGKALAPDGASSDLLGYSVSVQGSKVLIGAITDDDACSSNPICESGSAYLFDLAPDATQFCSCPMGGTCGNVDDFGGCRHSLGYGAILSAGGSSSVASDVLRIEARWLPPNKPGILFMGGAYGAPTPFGDGGMCVQPGAAGLFRFTPPQSSGAQGAMSWGPGLIASTAANPPAGQISAGQSWYFQTWFRDPDGPCGQTYNLSSALRIAFTP